MRVDDRDSNSLSVCSHNGNYVVVKSLIVSMGQWEIEDQPFKKLS